jgi:hypothetical protein
MMMGVIDFISALISIAGTNFDMGFFTEMRWVVLLLLIECKLRDSGIVCHLCVYK